MDASIEQVPVAQRRSSSSAEQLIDATAALLGERTAVDVSLNEISKRAGLNSALIKYYFGNKEGLLLAVLKRDAEMEMGALVRLIDMPISAEQKVRIHISGIINSYYRSPYLNRLIHHMVESTSEDAARHVVDIFIDPMISAYRALIDQGVKDGTFRPVDPALFYCSLVGACDHLFHAAEPVKAALGMSGMTDALKQRYTAHVTAMCLQGLLQAPAV